jgi:nucleoside-diphosphate-sugar epimerase
MSMTLKNNYPQFNHTKVLVAGGAGFIGSHLVDKLLQLGAQVTVVDNLVTGDVENLRDALTSSSFNLIEADVSQPVTNYTTEKFNFIFHLASPASPKDFETIPKEIYKVNGFGTHFMAEFASQTKARLLFAGTSEAYGDPLEHPQKESYFGNVNSVGPRACYDESKRFGEMVMSVWAKTNKLDGRIVRIFNTYGPRMQSEDGRVIPAFITQALNNLPITVHAGGAQTRSFCYVSDLVEYLLLVMVSEQCRNQVVNIGNPEEHSIREVAERIVTLTKSKSQLKTVKGRAEDPERRKPDLTKVITLTGFQPKTGFDQGLNQTIKYFREVLNL